MATGHTDCENGFRSDIERKVEQILHPSVTCRMTMPFRVLPSSSDVASRCHWVGSLVGQHGRAYGALGACSDAHGPVFDLFEDIGLAANATQQEVLHATRDSFVTPSH